MIILKSRAENTSSRCKISGTLSLPINPGEERGQRSEVRQDARRSRVGAAAGRRHHKNNTMSSERPLKTAVSVRGGKSDGTGGIHLTPELIARVATFADAVGSPDVMNICIAVGPDTSRPVRYYYLKRNVTFLARVIEILRKKRLRHIGSKKVCLNHLAWMEVNADWRTIAVRDDWLEALKLASKRRETDQSKFNESHPLIAFNNPAVAVQIGLFDSLKHLVEDKGIDVNSFEWTAFGSSKRMHLLFYASHFRQKKIFKYLLNRPDFNLRCKASEKDGSHSLFLNLLDRDSSETGRFEHPFLTMFMQHPEFDINGQITPFALPQSETLVTPLFCATLLCCHVLSTDQLNEEMFRRTLQALDVLLSADADPNLSFPDCSSPRAYLVRAKEAAQMGNIPGISAEDYETRERYWDEAVALLEKYA